MFAYFIGGPWDLTKRAVKSADAKPYYVAEPMRAALGDFLNAHAHPEQHIPIIRHEYRRYFTEGDTIIYIYEGIR